MAGIYFDKNWPSNVDRLKSLTSSKINLKEGQVLPGKVMKIFPNQHAEVMLLGKPIIAKLLTSLNLNKNYWFQVESTGEAPHLRVLVDQPINDQNQVNILLKGLKLPFSKSGQQLLANLIDNDMTLQRSTLTRLAGFLSEMGTDNISYPTIAMMVKQGLPLTRSIYYALFAKNSTSLTEQLQQLLTQLEPNPNQSLLTKNLYDRVNTFLSDSNSSGISFLTRILTTTNDGQLPMLDLLKRANAIPESTTSEEWKGFQNEVVRLSSNHSSLMTDVIEQATFEANGKSPQTIQFLQSFRAKESTMLGDLRPLLYEKLPVDHEKILIDLLAKYDRPLMESWETIKDKFLIQLKHFVHFSGIDYENQLENMVGKQMLASEQSLKSLILQALNGEGKTEQLEQLLHTLNGIQLSGSNDQGTLSSIALQLPGNRLGALSDIYLTIKARKNKSNEINADFCHIYFYLQLEHLGETTIDMRIQKRTVHLTVRNLDSSVESVLLKFKPMLKLTLEKLNYQLSSVKFETFDETKERETLTGGLQTSFNQGVDLKI